MNDESRKKTQIFLLLAERRKTILNSSESVEEDDFSEKIFSALAAQMEASEARSLERMRTDFLQKSDPEKERWRERVESFIGTDELFFDSGIHHSHIDAALGKETAAIGKILFAGLPAEYRNSSNQEQANANGEKSRRRGHLEKSVRKTFAAQFISRRNLTAPTAFDDLNGARLARLIRLAGVREVALACAGISAVESVASFLRRFSAEDARSIAAQLNGLPETSKERLAFAEKLVHAAFTSELKPSAMLDLLGFWLIGILLCGGAPERVTYTEQKLPLEVEPKLSEIIETQCRKTPIGMRREIGRQIERLAADAANATEKVKL